MKVELNGALYEADPGLTVSALLEGLELRARRVAVAVNGEVVPRGEHSRRTLCAGDQVEVIEAAAGG